MCRPYFHLLIWPLLAVGAWGSELLPEKVGFNEHIRPILSNNCYYCHGPDEKTQEADLRLDVREGAIRDLGGYAAVVPGKPDESELISRVTSKDRTELMPPPKSKKPRLTDREVALLRKWIEQGAQYEGHWAFLPLSKAAPPAVKDPRWAANPIDRFVKARLEREGIEPSPETDRATLLRRVTLDLTGLLPTPEELRAFLADQSPGAYERVVDRLLASSHYGEKWGRHWLDQARYADSHGYTIDGDREMWPYRDWVIKALNDDMPFDRFTVEQLAGDLLPNPQKSQLIATAFHRNTLINQEGGTDKEQFRVEAAMDRVNTTGAVWLGLTVGCAQCHTHKFDPITQREYYQLMAFFNSAADANDKGPTVRVSQGEVFGEQAQPDKSVADAETTKLQGEWEKKELARLQKELAKHGETKADWVPAKYVEYDTLTNAGFMLLDDNSLLSDGRGAANDTYRVVASTSLPKVAAVRLRVLPHDSLPKKGPGLASNGNFVLTEFMATVGSDKTRIPIRTAFADHEQPKYPVLAAIDGDAKTGWAINVGDGSKPNVKMNAEHEAVFVFDKPVESAGGTLEFKFAHDVNEDYLIGRFALEFSAVAPTAPADQQERLLAALQVAPAKRNEAQRELVAGAFERAEPKARKSRKRKKENVELMIMRDLPQPRETYLLTRGDFTRPDRDAGALEPGVIEAVQAAFGTTAPKMRTRLDLARWLVDPKNPLTPRVTVNRIWMRYFGRGLVETEEDFGTQGTPPTHPDLMDWLAGEFIRQGWSMKKIHRLIVTSATYRQSSKARPDLEERDPRNLLLARQERLRFEAELVRDAALVASGLLDSTVGGPGVKPPIPDGVFAFTQTKKDWDTSTGPERYRRALYTVYYRSAPYPLFTTFDAPDFQMVCTRRNRSNTPLQSLTMANDIAFVELAQGLAGRLAREVPGRFEAVLDARVRRGFELALGRAPSEKELSIVRSYALQQVDAFTSDSTAAESLSGQLAKAPGLSAAESAALVCVARTIFNTDNFITRE